jgi:hypothetical protein
MSHPMRLPFQSMSAHISHEDLRGPFAKKDRRERGGEGLALAYTVSNVVGCEPDNLGGGVRSAKMINFGDIRVGPLMIAFALVLAAGTAYGQPSPVPPGPGGSWSL